MIGAGTATIVCGWIKSGSTVKPLVMVTTAPRCATRSAAWNEIGRGVAAITPTGTTMHLISASTCTANTNGLSHLTRGLEPRAFIARTGRRLLLSRPVLFFMFGVQRVNEGVKSTEFVRN